MILSGKVIDAFNGALIEGASIRLEAATPTADLIWGFTTATGRFTSPGFDPSVVTPGAYRLVISHPGYQDDIDSVVLGSGQVTKVTIPLKTRTVVLVHGLLRSKDVWGEGQDPASFTHSLEQNGFNVFRVDFWKSPPCDPQGYVNSGRIIEELADDMQIQVQDSVETLGIHSYDLVAHSMGGLVSRLFVKKCSPAEVSKVRSLVTLGTPHHGSPVAIELLKLKSLGLLSVAYQLYKLLGGSCLANPGIDYPAAWELIPGCGFLNALNYDEQCGVGCRIRERLFCWSHDAEHLNPSTKYYAIAGTSEKFPFFSKYMQGCDDDGLVPITSAQLWNADALTGSDISLGCPSSYHLPEHQGIDSGSPFAEGATVGLLENDCIRQRVGEILLGSAVSAGLSPVISAQHVDTAPPLSRLPILSGSVLPSESFEDSCRVDALSEATFWCIWGGDSLAYSLVSPSGIVIDPAYAISAPNIDFWADGSSAVYEIHSPEAGVWHHKLSGAMTEPDTFAIMTFLDTGLVLDVQAHGDVLPAESFELQASFLNGGSPIPSATVAVDVTRPDGTTDIVYLVDDGTNGDTAIGDGEYHGSYSAGGMSGLFSFAVLADEDPTSPSSRKRQVVAAASARTLAELSISPTEFQLSDATPPLGATVGIFATVRNTGLATAGNARAVIEDRASSEILADTVVTLPPGGSFQLSATWLAANTDTSRFVAWVSDGGTGEGNYSNNSATCFAVVANPEEVVTGVGGGGPGPGRSPRTPAFSMLKWSAPNPFSGTTVIAFDLPVSLRGNLVDLTIYDVAGRRVRQLVRKSLRDGEHRISWDGRNDGGSRVTSGIYFGRLSVAGHVEVSKLAVIR